MEKSFHKKRIAAVMFCLLFFFFNSLVSYAQDEIRLIVRGDDLGMTQGSIAAFHKAFNQLMPHCDTSIYSLYFIDTIKAIK